MGSLADRVRMARKISGKTERAVAYGIGLDLPSYYDLETHDDELTMCLSLGDVSALCKFLGIDPAWLYSGEERMGAPRISLAELADRIRSYIARSKMTVDQFEDSVGWVISPCFDDWHNALSWNVDCLRSVCSAIGVDWLAALPRD